VRKKHPWIIPAGSLAPGANRFGFDVDIEEMGGGSLEVSENPAFLELLGPVAVDVNIVRDGRRFLIQGEVKFRARLACSLCAVEFERGFTEPIETEFASWQDDPAETRELSEDELRRSSLKGDMIDLGTSIHDAVHLAVPMAPVCRDDCKGVCAWCGIDLNTGRCDCAEKAKVAQHPFAALKEPGPTDETG